MSQLRQFDGVFLKPQVALTVTDRELLTQIRKVIRRARRIVPLFLEIRIDCFRHFDVDYLRARIQNLHSLKIPLILTIRSRREGGARSLTDSKRLFLFKSLLPWAQVIDVELASNALRKALIPLARQKRKKVILSYHDFRRTPSQKALTSTLQKAKRARADWIKIAVTARKKRDLAQLLLFTERHRHQNLITVSMGKWGQPSRVLGFLFGSRLTYSFVGRPQAPGQLSFSKLLSEWKALGIR